MLQVSQSNLEKSELANEISFLTKQPSFENLDTKTQKMRDSGPSKLLAKFVNQMVASAYEFSAEQLKTSYRGSAKEARARQISIYLMHTCLSFSLTDIAKIYGKDRTTVGHACRLIEDLRDEPAFDDRLIEFEQTVETVLALANTGIVACKEVKND